MEGVDSKRKWNKIPRICSYIHRNIDEMVNVIAKVSKHGHDIGEVICSHGNLKANININVMIAIAFLYIPSPMMIMHLS